MADGVVDRLTQRLDRKELRRQSMADGGAVFRGEIASRALKAVGARAMTVDQTIIVDDDFDANRPADAALYAHERYHEVHGDGEGGGGGANFRDAEEVAARAVERMVFHRMEGGTEGGYMAGASSDGGAQHPRQTRDQEGGRAASAQSADEKNDAVNSAPDVERGYRLMLARGMTHRDIVDQLAEHCVAGAIERSEVQSLRGGKLKGGW